MVAIEVTVQVSNTPEQVVLRKDVPDFHVFQKVFGELWKSDGLFAIDSDDGSYLFNPDLVAWAKFKVVDSDDEDIN